MPEALIIVDDGSADETEELVSRWRQENQPGFTVIYEKAANRGVSAARNRGARLAQTEWLAFLDSDDEWLPEKLEKQILLADDFSLIHAQENWIRNGRAVQQPKKYLKSGGRIFKRCVDLCFISPSSVLIRKDLFEKMNGFREDFPVCEDYELWLRIAALENIGYIEEPLLNKYGGHADQLSMGYKAMDYFRAKALHPFLDSADLLPHESEHVAKALFQKCEILISGYNKYNQFENLSEVQAWCARSQRR